MAKEKTISDEFIKYAKKNKLFRNEQIDKMSSIEALMAKAVTSSLAVERSHAIDRMGEFKKDTVVEKKKRSVLLEYDPSDGYTKKLSNKHKRYKMQQEQRKKQLIMFGIPAVALLIVLVIVFIIIGVNSGKNNVTTDTTISAVKTDDIDTSIKEGEYRIKEVVINGVTYNEITYTAKKGDMLHTIAGRFLKNTRAWPKIHELNKDFRPDPDVLEIGDQIVILIKK